MRLNLVELKNFFSFFSRENFPGSEKKSFYEKFAGRQQYTDCNDGTVIM
jgi:hypothetical protein